MLMNATRSSAIEGQAAAEHHQVDPHVVRQRPAPSCSRRVMPTRAPMRSRLFSDEKGRLKPIAS